MPFCVDVVTPPDNFRAVAGVLRASSLALISDAHVAAHEIRQKAEAEAQVILDHAQSKADSAVHEAQQQTLESAQQLLQSIEQAHATFLDKAQGIVIDLAQGLLDRLVIDMTPRERIEASMKRLLLEAPPKLVNAVLRVHPEDAELLPAIDWEIKPDASLTRATCRLEASNGEWFANFDAAVSALKAALPSTTETPE